tara:strand:+ start:4120 stop:5175 length:1056 start_codon:yes stop_codon:yes gene_type:complete
MTTILACIRRSLVAAVLMASIGGCSGDESVERRVVVYVSVDEHVARAVLDEFEHRTGIDVLIVGDSEASKTTGLVQRLRSERDAPVADVFWSSEAMQTIALADEGILSPHEIEEWPKRLRDPAGRWFAFSPRPRVIVYDPRRVSEADRPSTWEEAVDGRFAGRIAMADPRFGTTGGHLAAMESVWCSDGQPHRFDAFVEGLRSNRVRILPGGNAAVVEAVVGGEADIGFTDADDVRAARARGLEIEMLTPRHHRDAGGGTFMMPNTVAIVEGGSNSAEAVRLLEFLLSADVARMLARSVSGNMPLQPEVASEFPELVIDDPLDVDLDDAASRLSSVLRRTVEAVRQPGGSP